MACAFMRTQSMSCALLRIRTLSCALLRTRSVVCSRSRGATAARVVREAAALRLIICVDDVEQCVLPTRRIPSRP